MNSATAIHLIFQAYILMLMIRVVGSWFPRFSQSKVMVYISRATDPYLNIFRRLIPPIGGVLDLSPILGFFALSLAENLLFRILFHA